MQLCTKKVVITRVINDPTNFRIFPLWVLFNLNMFYSSFLH